MQPARAGISPPLPSGQVRGASSNPARRRGARLLDSLTRPLAPRPLAPSGDDSAPLHPWIPHRHGRKRSGRPWISEPPWPRSLSFLRSPTSLDRSPSLKMPLRVLVPTTPPLRKTRSRFSIVAASSTHGYFSIHAKHSDLINPPLCWYLTVPDAISASLVHPPVPPFSRSASSRQAGGTTTRSVPPRRRSASPWPGMPLGWSGDVSDQGGGGGSVVSMPSRLVLPQSGPGSWVEQASCGSLAWLAGVQSAAGGGAALSSMPQPPTTTSTRRLRPRSSLCSTSCHLYAAPRAPRRCLRQRR